MKPDASVSVIVPTRNSASTLDACLRSINAQTYPHIELVVVDRDSTDATPRIARDHGARFLTAHPERSAQRNAGARVARGPWLLFIDSDMVLEPDVVAACVAATQHDDRPPAIVIPERGFDDTFLARIRSLEKRCYIGNEDVEAARLYPRAAFLELGGFDESLTGCEDWDLTDRWREEGGAVRRVDAFIIHDDRTLRLRHLVRKRVLYGRGFSTFVRKQDTKAFKHLRPSRFLRRPGLLAREPLTAAGLLLIKVLETAAFALGVVTSVLRRPDEPVFGRTRRATEALAATPGARVLDAGCSGGWLARSQPGRQVIGTDLSLPEGAVPSGPVARADARILPFATGTFDVVCFFDVLEHLSRGTEEQALREIHRVLRPGGTLLLSTPHRHILGCLLDPAWWVRGHRHYRVDAVRGMLAETGFEDVSTSVHGAARDALYVPMFYLFKRLRLRLPFERRWQRAIDVEYQRPGWYTIFSTSRRPETDRDRPVLIAAGKVQHLR